MGRIVGWMALWMAGLLAFGGGAGDVPKASPHALALELCAAAERDAELIIEVTERNEAFQAIASARKVAGDIAGAKAILTRINDPKDKAWVDQCVAADQARGGDIAAAKATAAQIGNPEQKAVAYRGIAEVQAKAGDIAGAKGTAMCIVGDELQKGYAYAAIAGAQAKAGEIAAAKATAAQIGDGAPKCDACAAIGAAQIRAGDTTGAQISFRSAMEVAALTKNKFSYHNIVEERARAGDIIGAKAMATQISDSDNREWAYRAIGQEQARAGDITGARETAVKLSNPKIGRHREWVFTVIAVTQARLGDIAGARVTAMNEVTYRGRMEMVYGAITAAQAKAGGIVLAVRQVVETEDDPRQRRKIYTDAVQSLCNEDWP